MCCLYLCLFVFLFSLVVGVPQRLNQDECVDQSSSQQPITNLYPEILRMEGEQVQLQNAVEVTIAKDFSVEYYPTYKVLKNIAVNETYVLYACGTQPPSIFQSSPGTKVFETPLHSIAVDDTTVLTFLDLLGVGDRVKYTSPFSTAACFQKLLQDCDRSTQELVAANEDPLDYNTRLNDLAEDEIDAFFTFSARADEPLMIAFTATSDPGMLNRLEWVKFVSVFFNLESKANQLYDLYADTYNSIEIVDGVSESERPLVAWISQTSWTTPVSYTVSFADYKLELIGNGGGKTFDPQQLVDLHPNVTFSFQTVTFDPSTISQDLASQLFIENVLKPADIVIDESYYASQGEYGVSGFMERFGLSGMDESEFPFLANKKLYTLDKSTGIVNNATDWFETAVVLAHETLIDFVAVQQPERAAELGLRQPRWLRNIATNEDVLFISPDECQDAGCEFQPLSLCPLTDIACLTA
eukprot:TRINITY_DN1758_c0_g1_i4.p1 TRINITY_DN1758_c0_g1~~TRINITY_DN1758_c0_g1_i4.p1  ORF type:complete len:469 (-),score=96.76 TRINITY_DN1758_c0_g1_i4:148-1554(-)